MTREEPSVSGLLPLKVSGRHYGDNLARLDLLFSSLTRFAAPDLLDELIVVVRADEADLVVSHLEHWPELPLRIVVEDDHFAVFRRYTRPWQVRPWQRQQIIKLNAPAFTDARFVLTLDPDVIAVKPITRETLLPRGRALLEPEARSVHRKWWRNSADLLDVDPGLDRPGIGVTPALLSTTILDEVHRRLEGVGGRPWMDVLLTSYCDWTEYTLYLLAGERAALVERDHAWPDETSSRLQVDPGLSIWDEASASRERVEHLFASGDRGVFAVVQSNSGLPAAEVAEAVGDHFPVRSVPAQRVPEANGRSKLEERSAAASRRVAAGVYRVRRELARR